MNFLSIRAVWFFSCLATVGLLLLSIWLQMQRGIIPCPLCTLQRMAFAGLALVFLSGVFCAGRIFHFFIGLFSTLIAAAGLFFALRQVWLQYYASGMHENCGVSLQYLVKVLPWDQVVTKVLAGSSECSQVLWQFMHLSLAEWSLCFFVLFVLVSVTQMFRSCKASSRY